MCMNVQRQQKIIIKIEYAIQMLTYGDAQRKMEGKKFIKYMSELNAKQTRDNILCFEMEKQDKNERKNKVTAKKSTHYTH